MMQNISMVSTPTACLTCGITSKLSEIPETNDAANTLIDYITNTLASGIISGVISGIISGLIVYMIGLKIQKNIDEKETWIFYKQKASKIFEAITDIESSVYQNMGDRGYSSIKGYLEQHGINEDIVDSFKSPVTYTKLSKSQQNKVDSFTTCLNKCFLSNAYKRSAHKQLIMETFITPIKKSYTDNFI